MTTWNKICCAIDFSEPSRHALQVACDLSQRLGAQLTLVHVFDDVRGREDVLLAAPELLDRVATDVERKIAEWRSDATLWSGRQVHSNVLEGQAAETLLRYLSAHDYDLVVMASHGRSGLPRLVLGSVAERVMRNAGCPVLVVRGGAPEPD